MNQQQFQQRLQAAQLLGLEVDESYVKISGDYFQTFVIKKGEEVVESQSFAVNRTEILQNMKQMRDQFTAQAAKMQEKIDEIEALEQG